MRRALRYVILAAAAGLAAWIALYPSDWQFWLGFTKAAYFTTGQNYAFYSGFGAMASTTIGLSSLLAGVWHHVNCHVDGCLRVGRYPLAGGSYKVCRVHLPPGHPARDGGLTAHHIHRAHREHGAGPGA